jgi:hypothetical protein
MHYKSNLQSKVWLLPDFLKIKQATKALDLSSELEARYVIINPNLTIQTLRINRLTKENTMRSRLFHKMTAVVR